MPECSNKIVIVFASCLFLLISFNVYCRMIDITSPHTWPKICVQWFVQNINCWSLRYSVSIPCNFISPWPNISACTLGEVKLKSQIPAFSHFCCFDPLVKWVTTKLAGQLWLFWAKGQRLHEKKMHSAHPVGSLQIITPLPLWCEADRPAAINMKQISRHSLWGLRHGIFRVCFLGLR